MKNMGRAHLTYISLLICMMPIAAHADTYTLKCEVKSYAHSGFSSQNVMESWFPRTTTHIFSEEKVQLVEQGYFGEYKEKSGRIKMIYAIENSEGETVDVVYTFIKKTNIFTVRLDVGGNYKETSGTQGICIAQLT